MSNKWPGDVPESPPGKSPPENGPMEGRCAPSQFRRTSVLWGHLSGHTLRVGRPVLCVSREQRTTPMHLGTFSVSGGSIPNEGSTSAQRALCILGNGRCVRQRTGNFHMGGRTTLVVRLRERENAGGEMHNARCAFERTLDQQTDEGGERTTSVVCLRVLLAIQRV